MSLCLSEHNKHTTHTDTHIYMHAWIHHTTHMHTRTGSNTCLGRQCWSTTFLVIALLCAVALMINTVLICRTRNYYGQHGQRRSSLLDEDALFEVEMAESTKLDGRFGVKRGGSAPAASALQSPKANDGEEEKQYQDKDRLLA